MNVIPHAVAASCLLATLAHAQNIPATSTFTGHGTFKNVSAESAASSFLIDDQLDDGYAAGADLYLAPIALLPTAQRGNAFFQWGTPESADDHSSALWYQSNRSTNVQLESPFVLGSLYYRNGTITGGSGITGFDLELSLARPVISLPNNLNPTVLSYGIHLIDTPDTGSASQNGDQLVLQETFHETPFFDANGKVYFLKVGFSNELNFPTADNPVFSVPEGSVGEVKLIGLLTTTVPEPSAAALGALGAMALLRRRRV